VTSADYNSHCAIYHILTEAFPGIIVISEETSKDCDKIKVENIKNSVTSIDSYDLTDDVANINDITIWIDPLDATKEFTGKAVYIHISFHIPFSYSSVFLIKLVASYL
jgi:inositol monophosphatase 3